MLTIVAHCLKEGGGGGGQGGKGGVRGPDNQSAAILAYQ